MSDEQIQNDEPKEPENKGSSKKKFNSLLSNTKIESVIHSTLKFLIKIQEKMFGQNGDIKSILPKISLFFWLVVDSH